MNFFFRKNLINLEKSSSINSNISYNRNNTFFKSHKFVSEKSQKCMRTSVSCIVCAKERATKCQQYTDTKTF